MKPETRRFGFLLFDNYPLLPVSAMMDVLRDTAYVTDRYDYDWCTIAAAPGPVTAMNGMRTLADYTLLTAPPLDVVVVCSGLNGHLIEDRKVIAWLRRLSSRNVMIGAIATGPWLLAKAGLLDNRRCTMHWEDMQAFTETFPLIDIVQDLYVFDGPVFTCAGGTGAIDLFLHIVARDLGPETSTAVARQIMYSAVRDGTVSQPSVDSPYKMIRQPSVRKALKLMQDNVEQPLAIADITNRSGASQKQLQRYFKTYFGSTPQLVYREMRLDHARTLVRLTDIAIWEIALITGFSTTAYFSKCYRDLFGLSPAEERRRASRFDAAPVTATDRRSQATGSGI